MRKLSKISAITAGIALAVGLSAGTALAASPAGGSHAPRIPREIRVVTQMKVAGFDAQVAKAHGYQIRTDSAGRQYAVKIGAAPGATPDVTVGGDCGTSYMDYFAQGNRTVLMESGFHVPLTITDFSWTVFMLDNGGLSKHHWGTVLLLPHLNWATSQLYAGMTPGPSSAWVSTDSYADLIDGERCYSAGPTDYTTIY